MSILKLIRYALLLWCLMPMASLAIDIGQYNTVFQIEVRDNASDTKVAIGSGFLLSEDDVFVTNFHVISQYIAKPNNHSIVLNSPSFNGLHLKVLAFDVINDIALLKAKRTKQILNNSSLRQSSALKIAKQLPIQGESIHAMGNPHNLGVKLVTGVYNGFVAHRWNQQILFSGSLNPGMSGGPSVNEAGEVIGVNVATAGGQLSFLIPISKVEALLVKYNTSGRFKIEDYQQYIDDQIVSYQQLRFLSLFEQPWSTIRLQQANVIAELRDDIQCWGGRSRVDSKVLYKRYSLSCNAGDSIYIENNLSSGHIHYSFDYYQSEELSTLQFSKLMSNATYNPDNRAGENHVTNYECKQQHLNASKQFPVSSISLCVRHYKELTNLYDVLFYSVTNLHDKGLISHFTLAGVTREIAKSFSEKFISSLVWKVASNQSQLSGKKGNRE